MEIASGQLIQGGQGLRVAVHGTQLVQGAPLIDDGHEARPLRRGGAGAADLRPAAETVAAVDRDAAVGVGVVGHIRGGALAACGDHGRAVADDEAALVAGLAEVRANAAAAAAPARFALVAA